MATSSPPTAPVRRGAALAALVCLVACGRSRGSLAADAAPADASADARASGAALPPEVRALQASLEGSATVAATVRSLADGVGPRLAGSPGDPRAVEWAVRAMRARGLVNVHTEGVTVPVWERGVETAAIVAPIAHKLAVTALGWSGATPPDGVEADVVRFDSLDALRAADPGAVAGKIVFLDVVTERTRDGHGYGQALPARIRGPSEAAQKKAVATVVRSIGTDHSRFPHAGATRHDDDARERDAPPAAALSNADADLLARLMADGGRVRLSLRLRPRWKPPAESANVVGEIPGSERPSDVVLLGAHLDSWDLGTGAIDDGAGCAIVLEAARAIAALHVRPRRTVRVVLFAAEENSLAGAKAYVTTHDAEVDQHVAALEADSGSDRVFALRYLGAPEGRARLPPLAAALAPLDVALEDEPAHGGADVTPLRARGVPILDLRQDMTHYFDVHHTADDTFAQIDEAAIAQAASAFASAVWTIAEMDGDFGRVPDAQRKP